MLPIPRNRPPDSSIVTIIDGLALVALDVGLHAELVEEDIESLVLVLREADQAVIEW